MKPGSSVPGDSPGKNTGMACHALLQGIFPTQGLNPGLPHCKQILYHLSHQRSSKRRGGRLNREGIYVYIQLIYVVTQQKPTQHCKAIFPQLKNKFRKKRIFASIFMKDMGLSFTFLVLSLFPYQRDAGLIECIVNNSFILKFSRRVSADLEVL